MSAGLNFSTFFAKAFGGKRAPYPYQSRLAEDAWPDVFIAPTGLGKTVAVTLAWAYKRIRKDKDAPRRLVWCLPMRTLVEQTADEAYEWMQRLGDDWAAAEKAPPIVHRLLGGSVDNDWVLDPAREAIIVGTQDMLISRALMRGYGMSRFRWPIDFALLHTDSLWVFDEVQLMSAGLATSAQLEAFRQSAATSDAPKFLGAPSRSLWLSATLDPAWLATIDFRKEVPNPVVYRWDDGDAPEPEPFAKILDATKFVQKIDGIVSENAEGKKLKEYAKKLGEKILGYHRPERLTLVIVNRVARAQALFDALKSAGRKDRVILLHSRFRPAERKEIVKRIRALKPDDDLIIISTQAVEAGVDTSSGVLITELAPWSSLVQRFGRCNRRGEIGTKRDDGEGAEIYWVDTADDEKAAPPYDLEELHDARDKLVALTNAAPRNLVPATRGPEARHVIRRKDFEELFDTDSDLMGFDIDIAPYVRDADDTDVQLFWRELPEKKEGLAIALDSAPKSQRDELCPAPIGAVNEWVKKQAVAARVFRLDILADGKSRKWAALYGNARRLKPGDMLMVASDLGGYDPGRGFDPALNQSVTSAYIENTETVAGDGDTIGSDPGSQKDKGIGLEDHLDHVRDAAGELCKTLEISEPFRTAVIRAAVWHDVGKAHEQFRLRTGRSVHNDAPPLAKAEANAWRRTWNSGEGPPPRPYFRHELASALAFLAKRDKEPNADLVAYLIAAHHGKVRMGLRSLPGEKAPDDPARLFARGVWDGDELPKVRVGEEISAVTPLRLDLMRMGDSEDGRPSWAARTLGLLAAHGPFALAFLEALVRLADWKASEEEQKGGAP